MNWYSFFSWPFWRIIDVCHFITGVMWHYHWYCGKGCKNLNPQLWENSKKMSFFTVVRDSWQFRNRDGG